MSAGGDIRIEKIRYIGAVYQIFPAPEPRARITVTLKERLQSVLARHTPFGGREAEIERLNAFVSTGSNGYLFLTGQSGFGKTALLSNWVKTLPREHAEVCYQFISRRDGVADEEFALYNLCQQLGSFHELSGELPPRTVELRSLYPLLITTPPPVGQRLIVIIDGLDEALNWMPGPDLFPHPLPDGVFIIFSAREVSDVDWLANLELPPGIADTLRLTTLGTGEIGKLLENAGGVAARQSNNTAFIESLHDVSEGDPFYLHFLVEDLQLGRVTERNIKHQPVGLNGYLGEWWKQLNEDVDINRHEAYDLLAILTIAKGPLRATELGDISTRLRKGALLNRELSGKLSRYLRGDSREGYTLSHPRFGDYIKSKFLPEEIQAYYEDLLNYCTRWREHTSAYALSHYAGHLFELGRNRELYELIDRDWMDAQFERVYSHRAFCGDVELAIAAASKTRTWESVVQIARNSLVYATTGSITESVPAKLLAVLAQTGQVREALLLIASARSPEDRIEAYTAIADVLLQSLDIEQAKRVLGQALVVIEAPTWEGDKILALNELVRWLSIAGDDARLAQALKIIEAEDLGQGKANALSDVALILAQTGNKVRAVEIASHARGQAEALEIDITKVAALSSVSQVFAKAGENQIASDVMSRAIEVLEGISDEINQTVALSGLGLALAQIGDKSRSINIASRALATLERVKAETEKLDVLGRLARAINYYAKDATGQLMYRALEALEALEEQPWNTQTLTGRVSPVVQVLLDVERAWEASILIQIYEALVQAGQLARAREVGNRALALIQATADESIRAGGLKNLAEVLAQSSNRTIAADVASRCLTVVETIEEASYKATALASLVETFGHSSNEADLNRALELARGIGDVSWQGYALGRVVEVLVQAQEFERPLKVVQLIEDKEQKATALTRITQELAHAGKFDQALEVVKGIMLPDEEVFALSAVAEALARAGEITKAKEIANRALLETRFVRTYWADGPKTFRIEKTVGSEEEKTSVLIELVRALARAKEFDRSLRVAETLPDHNKAIALSAVVLEMVMLKAQKKRANHIANRALAVAEALGEKKNGSVTPRIAPAEVSNQVEIEAIVRELGNENSKLYLLTWIAKWFAWNGQKKRAQEVANRALSAAEALKESEDIANVLPELANTLYLAGDYTGLNRVITLAETTGLEVLRAELARLKVEEREDDEEASGRVEFSVLGIEDYNPVALSCVAEALAMVGQKEKALEVGNRAFSAAETHWSAYIKGETLIHLCRSFGEARSNDGLNRISTIVQTIEEETTKAAVISQLAETWARLGEVEKAASLAESALKAADLSTKKAKSIVRSWLVRVWMEAGEKEKALDLANSAWQMAQGITDDDDKVIALCEAGSALQDLGASESSTAAINQALAAAGTIKDSDEKAVALSVVATSLAQTGNQEQALEIIQTAFLTSQEARRDCVFRILENAASTLATLKPPTDLWELYEAVQEVEGWWGLQ